MGFGKPNWFLPAPSAKLFVWLEGEKLTRAHLASQAFHAQVENRQVSLPIGEFYFAYTSSFTHISTCWLSDFEVLPTSFLCFENSQTTSMLIQPWSSGRLFRSWSSNDLEAAPAGLLEVLDTFSHFSYQFSEGQCVVVNLQGKSLKAP